MTTFIKIQYGENEEILMNPGCRQLIFMNYLREKCQYNENAFIDLLDENGKLANVHEVEPHASVRDNFEDRLIYIPVMLERNPDGENYKTIKPLLEEWEKLYPQLEKKIKIMTGEVKRKKSPMRGFDARGRSLDRKPSNRSTNDTGRSSSTLGRPSSISQAGRASSTNAGKQSAAGRKSMLGNKSELGKKGKGKKK